MAHVIALANHKGGCSKTTSAANLAAALAMRPISKRVLIIDADPQANLSTLFGCDPELVGMRLEDALDQPATHAAPTPWDSRPLPDGEPQPLAAGLHVLPCTAQLAVVALSHADDDNFEFRLAELVAHYRPDYDYIIIDTPPGIQPLSVMALLAADYVIAPIKPADFDIDGAIALTDMLETEIEPFNPTIKMLGVLVTQVDRRWRITTQATHALRDADIGVITHTIPVAVRVMAAPRYLAPTIVLEPDSRVGAAYRQVAVTLDGALGARAAARHG